MKRNYCLRRARRGTLDTNVNHIGLRRNTNVTHLFLPQRTQRNTEERKPGARALLSRITALERNPERVGIPRCARDKNKQPASYPQCSSVSSVVKGFWQSPVSDDKYPLERKQHLALIIRLIRLLHLFKAKPLKIRALRIIAKPLQVGTHAGASYPVMNGPGPSMICRYSVSQMSRCVASLRNTS